MLKTGLSVLLTLILPILATLLQNQSPSPASPATQTEASTPSEVACSDSSTILPAKRSPEACAESDFALYGRPLMFPLRDGIAYGVSVAPDKPGSITIWMDNQSEKPQTTYMCCNATFVRYIDLYDQSGQRIPSRIEIQNAKSPLADPRDPRMVPACGCSGFVIVPPHSLKVIDHGDLSTNYAVAPGRYTIVGYVPPSSGARNLPPPSPTLPPSGPRLAASLP